MSKTTTAPPLADGLRNAAAAGTLRSELADLVLTEPEFAPVRDLWTDLVAARERTLNAEDAARSAIRSALEVWRGEYNDAAIAGEPLPPRPDVPDPSTVPNSATLIENDHAQRARDLVAQVWARHGEAIRARREAAIRAEIARADAARGEAERRAREADTNTPVLARALDALRRSTDGSRS